MLFLLFLLSSFDVLLPFTQFHLVLLGIHIIFVGICICIYFMFLLCSIYLHFHWICLDFVTIGDRRTVVEITGGVPVWETVVQRSIFDFLANSTFVVLGVEIDVCHFRTAYLDIVGFETSTLLRAISATIDR